MQCIVHHHGRARREELAALDQDVGVRSGAFTRRFDQRSRLANLRRRVVAQAFERERPAFERGEAAPHRFLRAGERLLRRIGALQPMARIAAQPRPERPAEQARDRNAEALALEIPQRDVERGQRRRKHRAAAPAPGVVETVRMALGTARILPDQVRRVFANRGFDGFHRAVQRAFAPAAKSLVGVDADEQPVHPVDPELERLDPRDAHLPENA